MSDLLYPEERREASVTATLDQYLWDLYGTDEEDTLGERGIIG